jgi:hypothetical protein
MGLKRVKRGPLNLASLTSARYILLSPGMYKRI